MRSPDPSTGWGWLEQSTPGAAATDSELADLFLLCFAGTVGDQVLAHLRRAFLDRRVAPSASDAELRHVEGQRSVVAYIQSLIDRGRAPHEDRS